MEDRAGDLVRAGRLLGMGAMRYRAGVTTMFRYSIAP